MTLISNFFNNNKSDLSKWSNAFIIISTLFTILYTIVDSKNDLKINIVLQNGTPMMQDMISHLNLGNSLVHTLILRQEDCGYLNKQRNPKLCEKSILAYEKVRTEVEISYVRTTDSQEKYTSKVNDLAENYNTYNLWQFVFATLALLFNVGALILNHKAKS